MSSDKRDSEIPLTKSSQTSSFQSSSRTSGGRPTPGSTPKSRFWKNVRLATTCFLCVGAAAAGTVVGTAWHSKTMRGVIVNMIQHPITVVIHRDPLAGYDINEQLPANKRESINLLLLGCDVDYENGRPVVIKGSRGRSDSIMIAKMDFTNNTINVLSIPRDTAVHIPGHKINKINAAYSLGGPDLSSETIKDTFGIDSDYYISLNFETFRKIVDKLGGVDLTVDKRLDYDDNWGGLHVHLKPGFQHLTGNQAMGYVRMRHSDDDLHRAARQHAFIEAVKSKVTTSENFEKVPDIIDLVMDEIHTNLDKDALIAVMNWARKVPKENVQMATMPSFEGRSYVTVDIPKAEKVVDHIFFNDEHTVSIDAPGMSVVENLTSHTGGRGRHRHGSKQKAADAAVDGTDDNPFEDVSVKPGTEKSSGSDNGNSKSTDTDTDNTKKSDGSSDSGSKSDGGTKSSGGDKENGTGGKSGGDTKDNSGSDSGGGTKSGGDGKTNGTDKTGNN